MNRYLYVKGNPVLLIDLSGCYPVNVMMADTGGSQDYVDYQDNYMNIGSVTEGVDSTDVASELEISWDFTQLESTGTISGIVVDGTDMLAEVGIVYFTDTISNVAKPNNIGVGTWANMVDDEILQTTSTLKTVSKGAKALGYVVVVVDIGAGVYENVENGEDGSKIITDASVDTAFAGGGIYLTTKAGAAIGSLAPGPGTAAGAVGGFLVGVAYIVVTDVVEWDDKSLIEHTKEGINNLIESEE